MCTVSFIPVNGRFFITSNRDEHISRQPALPPVFDIETALLYPKDPKGNGTWISLKANGDVAVLLNGGEEPHQSRPPYRHSRGNIIPQLLQQNHPLKCFFQNDYKNIEPFTLIFFISGSLQECRWNGSEKLLKPLSPEVPHIWSSATLYTKQVMQKRKSWFEEWLENNPGPEIDDLFRFHLFAGEGDKENDLFMNRGNQLQTVSITAIESGSLSAQMHYYDTLTGVKHIHILSSINKACHQYEFH